MKNTITTIVYIAIYIYSLHGYANQDNVSSKYIFDALMIEDGVPSNFINGISKDSKGFLWVSTQGGGLSRYDGYEFVKFDVSSEPISLKSNYIRKTCEDDYNRLWVTSDYGIDIIDLVLMQKIKLSYKDTLLDKIMNSSATSVLKDSKGSIWIMNDTSIYKVDFETDGSIKKTWPLVVDFIQKQYPFSGMSIINEEIWVGYKGGIYKVIPDKKGSLILSHVSAISGLGEKGYVSAMIRKESYVWIATDVALYRYGDNDRSLKWYRYDAGNPYSISQNMVTCLAVTNQNELVAGTLMGLNFYNAENDRFERVSRQKDGISLNNDFVNCLLSDNNNLWVGTEGGGINKMTLRRLSIYNYMYNDKNKSSLSSNPVNAVLEDHNKNLWVGTVEGGLNLKEKGRDSFIHYTSGEGQLSHNSVSVLEEDNDNNLWIGTWGGGVNILDLDRLPRPSYRYIASDAHSNLDFIAFLKYDAINNGMWIGTNRNIYYYDIPSGSIKLPLPVAVTGNIKGVLGGLIDDKNKLWIGTSEGVIVVDIASFDHNKFQCQARFLTPTKDSISSLLFKNTTCMYQGHDKTIWIGSKGYGFCRMTPKDNTFDTQIYTVEQGLANNTIFGIIEDNDHLIWISTGHGISCYNPHTNRFVNFTKNDGLIDHQFYWNATYKSPYNNNLYFGSTKGLSVLTGFRQDVLPKDNKVIFTKLEILNNLVRSGNNGYLTKDITNADCLYLHERDKSFTIEFSALDYDNPSTVVYSYRLLGFDDKWIYTNAGRRFASYTNLKPGTYTLQVRSMLGSGDWSDHITELRIEVAPFFYKTTWFITICIILFVFVAIQLYKWRLNSLEKQKASLRKKVEERTKELESQKHLLEEQTEELKTQNGILVSQNEKISSQQKQLLEMSNKVQEAMADKMAFFTNITHEFRTPITLIIGPIERALKLSVNPKVIEQLNFVARNSKQLLLLVNQLMDFRKVESESLSIAPSLGNFLRYLNDILIPFYSFAQERSITLRKIYRLPFAQIMFDEEAMNKVVANLLSNAIKFTPDNGTITLYVGSVRDKVDYSAKLYICVSDTGMGINEDDIEKVFERFYQSKNSTKHSLYSQSGTGIGLYLCKSIVELQGGSICAQNNKNGRGTSVKLLLPLIGQHDTDYVVEDSINEVAVDLHEEADVTVHNYKMTILLVEDNSDMRSYIRSILAESYNVLEAENGVKALELLKNKSVDFIISDLMMPVMDGLELSRKVKADMNTSHIPFLMLTAKASAENQINSFKIGVDDFLEKPFNEELLLARINNIIETRKIYQRKFSLNMDIDNLDIAEESSDQKFLKKAIETVRENYTNPYYEVSDFVESTGVSKSLVNKKMQSLTGQSAGQFIRNYRLNIARELILRRHNEMNISEIAFEVGFNDPKYFTRCFTKHFGVAPSALIKSGKQ